MNDIKKRVEAIQGIPVSSIKPTAGQVLQYNGIEWTPTTLPTILPTDISGLQLWLRSDLGITLSGSQITGWADQSGTGDGNKNMVGPGGSANPSYNPSDSAYNGHPSINFVSLSSQYMNSTGTWASPIAQPYTIFVVGNDSGSINVAEVFVGGNTITQPWLYNISGAYSILSGGTNLNGTTIPTNSPKIFRGEYNGSGSSLSINQLSPNITGTVGSGNAGDDTGGVWLGVDAEYSADHYLNGRMVEVLIYDSILTYTQVISVQYYLSTRYNIPVIV